MNTPAPQNPTPDDIPTPTLTDSIIASRVPDEIVALVMTIGADESIDLEDDEVLDLLPSTEVVDAILATQGLREPSSVARLDQAQAWMDEQATWQDRAMKLEAELQKNFPFQKEQALKGQIPDWMTEQWAPKLLYKWADGLRDAVEEGEGYMKSKMDKNTGANNV